MFEFVGGGGEEGGTANVAARLGSQEVRCVLLLPGASVHWALVRCAPIGPSQLSASDYHSSRLDIQ